MTSSGYTINTAKAGFIVGQATAVALIKRLFVLQFFFTHTPCAYIEMSLGYS